MVGRTISHYKILEKIGQGGMGEVYLAQDTTLDRKVALKFLPEELEQDSTARKRFLREAKSAAALDHPYICHIHEVGEVEGKAFISMEFIRGTTLKERLVEGPLPLKEALEKATEIAEALEAAHKQKIVHRDLKPSNIMLTPEGHVKVMDFGLAKRVTPAEGQEEEITTVMTRQGATLGTVPYMSPEQIRGQEVDTRSDIFSFGVVLYEMLAGVNPFAKGLVMDTATAILIETVPPLTRYTDDIPVLLQHTVKKMLARDPERRYQHVDEVRIDLEELIGEVADSSMTPQAESELPTATLGQLGSGRWWKGASLLVLASFVMAAIITLIAVRNPSPLPTPPPVSRLAIVLPPTQQLIRSNTHVVAFAPDGKHLVYVANNRLYLRALDQLEATPMRNTEGASNPFFSPDGEWIGFFAAGELKKMAINGGVPMTLCDASLPLGASWGPDDTIVFGQGREGIWQVSAAGGRKEVLISADPTKNEIYHGPQILPGGKAVLFTVGSAGSWDEAQIMAQALETDKRQVLIRQGKDARYLPTGHLVYARARTLLAVPFDAARLEVTGRPAPILQGVRQASGSYSGAVQFSFSLLGSLVYVPDFGRTLVWFDREGQEEQLAAEPRLFTHPRVSPDGSQLVIADGLDVWTYHLARETLTRITFDPGEDAQPIWTPDGRRVVFTSARDGGAFNLFWKVADGTGQAERLTTSPRFQVPFAFSPDGKTLLFVEQNPETSWDIVALSMQGELTSQPLIHDPFIETRPVISPDGRWIAYVSGPGRNEVYVRPFPNVDEGKWQISNGGGTSPVWGPEGGKLFYRSRQAMMVVTIKTEPTFAWGSPEVLFTGEYLTNLAGRNYDISPDGQRFLMIKEGGRTEQSSTPTDLILVQNWFEELKRLVPAN